MRKKVTKPATDSRLRTRHSRAGVAYTYAPRMSFVPTITKITNEEFPHAAKLTDKSVYLVKHGTWYSVERAENTVAKASPIL